MNLEAELLDMGRKARSAAAELRVASPEQRTSAIAAMAQALRAASADILAANALDMIFCGAADSRADCRRVRRCRCDAVEGLVCSPVNLIRTLSKHRRHDFTAPI